MKEIKRAVCLMLCFVMVFGLLPVHAIAVDSGDSELQPGELLDQIPNVGALEEKMETTADGNLPGGTGWYRKTFRLPTELKDKQFVNNFDGSYNFTTVYVSIFVCHFYIPF